MLEKHDGNGACFAETAVCVARPIRAFDGEIGGCVLRHEFRFPMILAFSVVPYPATGSRPELIAAHTVLVTLRLCRLAGRVRRPGAEAGDSGGEPGQDALARLVGDDLGVAGLRCRRWPAWRRGPGQTWGRRGGSCRCPWSRRAGPSPPVAKFRSQVPSQAAAGPGHQGRLPRDIHDVSPSEWVFRSRFSRRSPRTRPPWPRCPGRHIRGGRGKREIGHAGKSVPACSVAM